MLMKRLLLLLGPAVSITGAVGLIMFGRAIVAVFDEVLTYRIVNPPEPLPASLGELRWVALSGAALVLGLVISCLATVMHDSQESIPFAGKMLQVMSGLMLFIGVIPMLWGLLSAKRGFMIIATSAATPKPEEVQEMVGAAAPMLTVGCTFLLIGSLALIVAGQLAVTTKSSIGLGTHSALGTLAAMGAVLLGFIASLLFIGIGFHGSALDAVLASSTVTPKPSELARHLAGVLNKSLLAFIIVGCQGIVQVVAAVIAPKSGESQRYRSV